MIRPDSVALCCLTTYCLMIFLSLWKLPKPTLDFLKPFYEVIDFFQILSYEVDFKLIGGKKKRRFSYLPTGAF